MLTKEKYEKLRAEGKTNKQIAKDFYISEATIYDKKKKWAESEKEEENPKAVEAPTAVEEKTDWKEKYDRLKEDFDRMGADYTEWQDEIERLNKENAELKVKYSDLRNACEDAEGETKELAVLRQVNDSLSKRLSNQYEEQARLEKKLKALEKLLPLYMG